MDREARWIGINNKVAHLTEKLASNLCLTLFFEGEDVQE